MHVGQKHKSMPVSTLTHDDIIKVVSVHSYTSAARKLQRDPVAFKRHVFNTFPQYHEQFLKNALARKRNGNNMQKKDQF